VRLFCLGPSLSKLPRWDLVLLGTYLCVSGRSSFNWPFPLYGVAPRRFRLGVVLLLPLGGAPTTLFVFLVVILLDYWTWRLGAVFDDFLHRSNEQVQIVNCVKVSLIFCTSLCFFAYVY